MLVRILPPSLVKPRNRLPTVLCDVGSLANTAAPAVNPALRAHAAMAAPATSSPGMMRQKYLYADLSKAGSPSVSNIVTCARLSKGTDAVGGDAPTTPARLGVDARSCAIAGAVSASSPLVSIGLQVTVCPRTPPARLMRSAAG